MTNSNENIKANGHIDKEEEFGKTSDGRYITLILIPLQGYLFIIYLSRGGRGI